jgi:8-oxo-dGTP pyrophosphatase MutT (NUDIX family)
MSAPVDQDRLATKVFGERTIYDSRWVRLGMVDIEPPDGRRFEHHVVHLHNSAIALLTDQDQVLMQWRHRFAIDQWGWEFLGGLVETGEDPAVTAARESEEESGWRPVGDAELLTEFEPVPGIATGHVYVYRWRSAQRVGEPTDMEEASDLQWKPMAELPELVRKGELLGAATVISALCLLQFP